MNIAYNEKFQDNFKTSWENQDRKQSWL